MERNAHRIDRAIGVLLGGAAGDALGAGYEFTHPARDAVIDMIGGGTFDWAPGEWTDDTSMALAIAEVAAAGVPIGHGAGLDAIAARFVAWFDSNPPDIGNQTRAVLSTRPEGADAMRTRAQAVRGRKGGNGSLMRTAPVALAYLDDERACRDAAAAISALTHDDVRATEACQLWTHAIRHAVLHGTFDGVRGFLETAPSDVAEFWSPLLDQAETGSPADFPNNGWVVHALQTAWWAIATTDDSDSGHLVRALEAAVRAGGDTDTTSAIAGGLLGARWGAGAVPLRWRRMLHGWPGFSDPDLVRLAEASVRGRAAARSGPVIEVAVGDITTQLVDVIVNAANSALLGGGGVDGAIHRAGGPRILAECKKIRTTTLPDGLPAGDAVATTAGNLPATWVVHTVGPVHSSAEDRSAQLRSAYTRSLAVADDLGARSVAFPLISSGSYGWPRQDAVRQAVDAIRGADSSVERVVLVAFDAATADLLRRALD